VCTFSGKASAVGVYGFLTEHEMGRGIIVVGSRITRSVAAIVAALVVSVPGVASADVPDPDVWFVTASTVLGGDWYGSIVIDADNVTLNCAGNTVFGPGVAENSEAPDDLFPGILIRANGVTVKNCTASGFGGSAIAIAGSNATVKNNTVTASGGGFGVFGDNNLLKNNRSIENDVDGFLVQYSNNRLVGNRAVGGTVGFSVEDGTGNEFTRNVAQGSQVGYEIAVADGTTLTRNVAKDTDSGFSVTDSSGVLMRRNTARNSGVGFSTSGGDNIVIVANKATRNNLGFDVSGASNVELKRNRASNNVFFGIEVGDSTTVDVVGNHVTRNGIDGGGDGGGMKIDNSTDVTATRNFACRNEPSDAIEQESVVIWTQNRFCTPIVVIPSP
jgi:parallel beta-helix repeat protein